MSLTDSPPHPSGMLVLTEPTWGANVEPIWGYRALPCLWCLSQSAPDYSSPTWRCDLVVRLSLGRSDRPLPLKASPTEALRDMYCLLLPCSSRGNADGMHTGPGPPKMCLRTRGDPCVASVSASVAGLTVSHSSYFESPWSALKLSVYNRLDASWGVFAVVFHDLDTGTSSYAFLILARDCVCGSRNRRRGRSRSRVIHMES